MEAESTLKERSHICPRLGSDPGNSSKSEILPIPTIIMHAAIKVELGHRAVTDFSDQFKIIHCTSGQGLGSKDIFNLIFTD